MNGMFLGSSTSYLPLQVGGNVSDLDLPAPAKTKPRVRVCRHATAGGQKLSGHQVAAGESLPKHPASPSRAGAAHPQGKPFLPALPQSPLPGPKLSQECSFLMPAAVFPRKPPEMSLRRVMATQAWLGCIHTSDRTAPG